MKNKIINVKTIIIIVLIGIIISMFLFILNIKDKTIEGQKIIKEQLEETTEDNAYITLEAHNLELKEKQQEINNMQNTAGQATATADKILKDYTAYKNGQLITGTMENRGAWTNTPTGSGKVTIPAGYHNGSGYVNTATVYNNGYNAGYNDGGSITIPSLIFDVGGSYDSAGKSKITLDVSKYSKLTIKQVILPTNKSVSASVYPVEFLVYSNTRSQNLYYINTVGTYSNISIDISKDNEIYIYGHVWRYESGGVTSYNPITVNNIKFE